MVNAMKEIILNKLPAPTWSWLKLNDKKVSYETEPENILPKIQGLSECTEYTENGSTLLGSLPFLKSGNEKSTKELFSKSIPIGLRIKKSQKNPISLTYNLSDGLSAAAAQIIKAEKDTETTLIILSKSSEKASGLEAVKTTVFAGANSTVHIVKVQILGENFTQIDETETFVEEGAKVEVSHVVIGGKETCVGVETDLSGEKSEFKSEMGYFCQNLQELDMNYIVNHIGKKSFCRMYVYGSLKDKAKKTYRGTIDLKQGSSGADGEEQEEVLLLSPDAVNNSMPVILCTEDDVRGEHGDTIGSLSDEIIFYMASRGISKSKAENIVARSKVQRVANKITDEKILEETNAFMYKLFGEK